MALQISKSTKNGFTVNYFIIDPIIVVDFNSNQMHIRIKVYVNEAAYLAGKEGLNIQELEGSEDLTFSFIGQSFIDYMQSGDPRPQLYTYLKNNMDFFSGAIEV